MSTLGRASIWKSFRLFVECVDTPLLLGCKKSASSSHHLSDLLFVSCMIRMRDAHLNDVSRGFSRGSSPTNVRLRFRKNSLFAANVIIVDILNQPSARSGQCATTCYCLRVEGRSSSLSPGARMKNWWRRGQFLHVIPASWRNGSTWRGLTGIHAGLRT